MQLLGSVKSYVPGLGRAAVEEYPYIVGILFPHHCGHIRGSTLAREVAL